MGRGLLLWTGVWRAGENAARLSRESLSSLRAGSSRLNLAGIGGAARERKRNSATGLWKQCGCLPVCRVMQEAADSAAIAAATNNGTSYAAEAA